MQSGRKRFSSNTLKAFTKMMVFNKFMHLIHTHILCNAYVYLKSLTQKASTADCWFLFLRKNIDEVSVHCYYGHDDRNLYCRK